MRLRLRGGSTETLHAVRNYMKSYVKETPATSGQLDRISKWIDDSVEQAPGIVLKLINVSTDHTELVSRVIDSLVGGSKSKSLHVPPHVVERLAWLLVEVLLGS